MLCGRHLSQITIYHFVKAKQLPETTPTTTKGCPWDPQSPMFHQSEDEAEPVLDWSFTLGPITKVDNILGWPAYGWMPDGHISTVYDNATEEWIVFYPNSYSYRSRGDVALPDLQSTLEPNTPILGGKLYYDAYNNGGEWLDAVFPTSENELAGFIHAEDQFWDDSTGSHQGGGRAYKSISLACSRDRGKTWQRKGQVLTEGKKPSEPDWSGIGDFDVVWDWQNKRWFMVASQMRTAVSYDKGAGNGTWMGWDGAEYIINPQIWRGLKDVTGTRLPNGTSYYSLEQVPEAVVYGVECVLRRDIHHLCLQSRG